MKLEKIILAGGCFWGTEEYLKSLLGVEKTSVGYALGKTPTMQKPLVAEISYEEVCNHSGHAEAVEVMFNPDILPLAELLKEFSYTIDPTSLGRQGMDIGIQYRTGVYYENENQKEIILDFLLELQKDYERPIAIECLPLLQYILAEEYHQNYLTKNPTGYCHINFANIAKKKQQIVNKEKYSLPSLEVLKAKLTPLEYAVTQENKTEAPFTNAFWQTTDKGLYVDCTTGEPLFTSRDKFHSSCGWPSFSKPLDPNTIIEFDDTTHNMIRTEVRSRVGNAHLGHVFTDGPKETGGLRYCINSASLIFIPKDEMEEKGYGEFLKFI